jgi:hypothetical protein
MSVKDYLIVVFTSASVSTFVTWLMKRYFQHILDRRLQLDIENAKCILAQQTERLKGLVEIEINLQKELLHKRLDVYPTVMQLAYEIRKMARLVVSDVTKADSLSAKKFRQTVAALELSLCENILYFDQDGVTNIIHRYKNQATTFNVVLGDIVHLRHSSEEDVTNVKLSEASTIYHSMDELFGILKKEIIAATIGNSSFLLEKKTAEGVADKSRS